MARQLTGQNATSVAHPWKSPVSHANLQLHTCRKNASVGCGKERHPRHSQGLFPAWEGCKPKQGSCQRYCARGWSTEVLCRKAAFLQAEHPGASRQWAEQTNTSETLSKMSRAQGVPHSFQEHHPPSTPNPDAISSQDALSRRVFAFGGYQKAMQSFYGVQTMAAKQETEQKENQ